MEVKKRQNVIANLMRNPHLIKVAVKTLSPNKEPNLMLPTTEISIEEPTKDEELVVEVEKKCMRDGRSKEGTSVTEQQKIEYPMQIDEENRVIQCDAPYDGQVEKNNKFSFLLAGPASQACQEK
jgi:hypothetical protein